MASISVYDISSTSFSVMLTGLQTDGVTYTRKCQWNVRETSSNNSMGSAVTYISPGETEGGDCTFSGMSANTEYSISCTVYRTDTGAWLASFSEEVTTSDSSGGGGDDTEEWMYYHTIVGTIPEFYEDTETYVPKYIVQVFQFRFERDGIAKFYSFLSGDTIGYLSDSLGIDETSGEPSGNILAQNDDDNGWEFGFEYEVSAYTTYYLYVRHQFGDTGGYIQIGIEAPIDPSLNLPYVATWSWSVTSDSAVSGLIKTKARNAARDKTATTNFDHRVWNAMVDKVYEIVDKCGYGWDSYYETYSRTLMNTSPYELMADMFNSLRYNIGIHYSTGIQEVDPGDIVYGEYFLTLATCINEWIDQLRNDGILAQPT